MDFFITAALIVFLFVLLGMGVWIETRIARRGLDRHGVVHQPPGGRRDGGDDLGHGVVVDADCAAAVHLDGRGAVSHQVVGRHVQGPRPMAGKSAGPPAAPNIIGCTIFAAVSGSSAATCATIGKMTLPELLRRGYPEDIVIGTLAGAERAGTADSAVDHHDRLWRHGRVSIAQLFIGGVLPGLLLAGLFMGYVVVWSLLNPDKIPPALTKRPARKILCIAPPDSGGAADRTGAETDLRRHRHRHGSSRVRGGGGAGAGRGAGSRSTGALSATA
jgi:hypothetical protein